MTYTPRLPPYAHQEAGVAKCNGAAGFAYLAEMGCVDGETEYLSRSGWIRIDQYDGGDVAQFDLGGRLQFVRPTAYLRKPVDEFVRFSTPEDCDQVLSLDHRILHRDAAGTGAWLETSPRAVLKEMGQLGRMPDIWFPVISEYGVVSFRLLGQPSAYTSGDGMMYCFAVPSTYLAFRRNGIEFLSGNTGKSCMTLYDWGKLYDANEIDDLLLIAPAGVYRNWGGERGETATHMDPAVYDRARVFTWRAGGGVGYKRELEDFLKKPDRSSPRIFLVNAESYQSSTGLTTATKEFLKGRRAMTVVDESTLMKNHEAARTKQIVDLKYHSPYRRILAGLPNPKSPLDLYSQFEFLDRRILGHANFFSYRAEFCVVKRVEMRAVGGQVLLNKDGTPKKRPEVVGYRNISKLQALVSQSSYRVTKDECLDLPPKIYMPLREVRMHPEQRRIYDDVKNSATSRLADGSFVTAQQVITQLLRLQQILCGHAVDEDGRVHEIPEYRTDALVEDLDAVGGKAIIWTVYRHSIQSIERRLKREFGERSVVSFYGDTSSDDRETAKLRFQEDQECLFFLGNQQTAGRGITLTAARAMIYHSNSPDLELRLQSEDRAHRAGLRHPVAYSDLHVPGTIDERWVRALRKKMDLSALVLGDDLRKWLI